jgi:chromosome segregation ATPase
LSAALWSLLAVSTLFSSGCATSRELEALRSQLGDQVTALRSDVGQARQSVEALRTDVTFLKSLGVALEAVKGRVDGMQASLQSLQSEAESHRATLSNLRGDFREFKVAHEGVAKETDRLRATVGSIEAGMIHQLQVEVNLARERIKQLEQVIETLQMTPPPAKEKEGAPMPKL